MEDAGGLAEREGAQSTFHSEDEEEAERNMAHHPEGGEGARGNPLGVVAGVDRTCAEGVGEIQSIRAA